MLYDCSFGPSAPPPSTSNTQAFLHPVNSIIGSDSSKPDDGVQVVQVDVVEISEKNTSEVVGVKSEECGMTDPVFEKSVNNTVISPDLESTDLCEKAVDLVKLPLVSIYLPVLLPCQPLAIYHLLPRS